MKKQTIGWIIKITIFCWVLLIATSVFSSYKYSKASIELNHALSVEKEISSVCQNTDKDNQDLRKAVSDFGYAICYDKGYDELDYVNTDTGSVNCKTVSTKTGIFDYYGVERKYDISGSFLYGNGTFFTMGDGSLDYYVKTETFKATFGKNWTYPVNIIIHSKYCNLISCNLEQDDLDYCFTCDNETIGYS